MRWGLAVSAIGQTGQSEAIHSSEACASMVVEVDHAARLIDGGGLHGGDLVLAQRLAQDVDVAGWPSCSQEADNRKELRPGHREARRPGCSPPWAPGTRDRAAPGDRQGFSNLH